MVFDKPDIQHLDRPLVRRMFLWSALWILCHSAGAVVPPQWTLWNNIAYDATGTPNLGVSARVDEHWTVGLSAGYRPWPTGDATQKWRHVLIAPQVRYWLERPASATGYEPRYWSDSLLHRHFFGARAIYSHYNVGDVTFPLGLYRSVRDERRQGDLYALGLTYGYSWILNRWWSLEAEAGVAAGVTHYRRYECPTCGNYKGSATRAFAMPLLGLNLVLNLPPRQRPVATPPADVIVTPPADTVPAPQPFMPVLNVVPDFSGRAGQLQQDNPVLAHISAYRPYDTSRILRKERGALYVHFDLADSKLNTGFRHNAATLDRIIDITRQILADTTSSVKIIQIVGLASIEGSVAANSRLAQRRADALRNYIQQQIPALPDSLFDVANGGEAWTEFRDQLNDLRLATADGTLTDPQLSLATLDNLIDIIDNEPDANRREAIVRQLNGGRTYNYLRNRLLADQRNSGYLRIYYDYVPDEAAAIINEASDLMSRAAVVDNETTGQASLEAGLLYKKALEMLLTVQADERAQNALGVALYMTGQHDAAMARFRRAADAGNEEARENLRQLEQQGSR